jgi:hypothetical protein
MLCPSRPEIAANLCEMDVLQGFDCLQFHGQTILQEHIRPMRSHKFAAIMDGDLLLELGLDPPFTAFDFQ